MVEATKLEAARAELADMGDRLAAEIAARSEAEAARDREEAARLHLEAQLAQGAQATLRDLEAKEEASGHYYYTATAATATTATATAATATATTATATATATHYHHYY